MFLFKIYIWTGFIATGVIKIPWHFPDISLTVFIFPWQNVTISVDKGSKEHISKLATPFRWWCQQNKLSPQWDYLIKFLSLDLANWSIYVETGESCCPKWSFSLTLSEIPWRFSSILPNVKISLTLCKIPWQFPDLEKFYFSLTFPWRLWTLFENVLCNFPMNRPICE